MQPGTVGRVQKDSCVKGVALMKFDKSWLNWRKVVLADRELSFYAKSIALYLNTFMNDSHDFAHPSIATIQANMNIGSRTTVIKYLNELVEKGWLNKKIRNGKSSIYYTAIPENILSSPPRVLVQEMDTSSPRHVPQVVQEMDSNKQGNNQLNKQRGKSFQFKPPTAKQVQDYLDENGITGFTGENFVNHYGSVGWMRGKTNIKDWEACVRTWKSNGTTASYGDGGI